MTWKVEYLRRLYETFRDWNKEDLKLKQTDSKNTYSANEKKPSYLQYVRDVFIKVGGYLPEITNGIVLGMTDGIRNIVLRYYDGFVLDHELGHILGMNEYQIRSAMAAGWRAPRWRFRLNFT